VISRIALRAAGLCASVPLLVALATPASAVYRDDGDEPGQALSYGTTLLIFGVLPVALFAIIALLVMLPSLAKGPRYRPGLSWWASPAWFGGPADPDAVKPERLAQIQPMQGTGGTRARW
jgi:hypothetical protein